MRDGVRRPSLALAQAVVLATSMNLLAAATPASALPATPESVVSMRIRILPAERYQELRDEWTAYTKRNPSDARGWMELAKAARYAGTPCEEFVPWARRAVELAPGSAEAHAVLGGLTWKTYCPSAPEDPSSAIEELETALRLDPTRGDPHFTLWVMRLYQGDREKADAHLRALLETRALPEPIVDFGHNLLVGLEPNAILVTNGDNDTYPALALQAARGTRGDVTVVNYSLLNTTWYRRLLREGPNPVPVPLLEDAPEGPQAGPALEAMVQALQASGWKRPLYVAITVSESRVTFPNRLSLEGLAYRVLPEHGEEPKIDLAKLEHNLAGAYRLESATSLGLDWNDANAIGRLMMNYAAIRAHLAVGLAGAGRKAEARARMTEALELCAFHEQADFGASLVEGWKSWDEDGQELRRWTARFGK